ncbi:MAG: ABC-2 transporter permease [Sporolactobacillus sp.]|nr:ABC-2 transporter permease [Sporolactobacillus sp.]
MLHLMEKEIRTQNKTALIVVFSILVLFYVTESDNFAHSVVLNTLFFSVSVGFIGYLMSIQSNFNTTEGERANNWLLVSLPVSRIAVVRAKYMMILVWWLIAYALSLLLNMSLRLVLGQMSVAFSIPMSILLSLCITVLFTGLSYPLYYWFGYRIAQLVVFFLFFAMISLTGTVNQFIGLKVVTDISPVGLLLVFAAATLVVAACSYVISVRIFLKRDF